MRIATTAMNVSASLVPMHWQIRAAQLGQQILERAGLVPSAPRFVEAPLPDVSSLKLEDIDLSNPFLWRQGHWRAYYQRLRDERPVHYQKRSAFGPFWSITRYEDILFVDKSHELFSAEPIITLGDRPPGLAVE
ncbi:MAG: hypothetical protein MRY60_13455, partial [Algiphilus sp.]|nr:hypothetical protein [Algiphilus sp.]